MTDLVKRSVKGSALTMAEFDGNYDHFSEQDALRVLSTDPRLNDARPMQEGDRGFFTVTGGVAVPDQNVIGNSILTDMAANTIKGRISAGTGDPEDLTPVQVRTVADVLGFSPDATVTTNYNTLTKSGRYTNTATNTTGAPGTQASWHVLHVVSSSTVAVQFAMLATSDNAMYRRMNSGTWNAWRPLVLFGQTPVAFVTGDRFIADRAGVQQTVNINESMFATVIGTNVSANQIVALNSAGTGFVGIGQSPDVPADSDTILNNATDVIESVYSNTYRTLLEPHAGTLSAGVLTIDLAAAPYANWTLSTNSAVNVKFKAIPSGTALGIPYTVTVTNTAASTVAVTASNDTTKVTIANEVTGTSWNVPAQIGASLKLFFDPRSTTHVVLSSVITSAAPT